jgi:hypothetical protein
MNTPTTTIGFNDLKPKGWYKVVKRDSLYVVYAKPDFDSQKLMTLAKSQMFMFIREAHKHRLGGSSTRSRFWVHIGVDDVFGYVNWNADDMDFQEVTDQ